MIVFSTFIDPALDLDLLPQWIRHYKNYCFDRYHAIVHVKPLALKDHRFLSGWKMLRDAGFETSEAMGPYGNGILQRSAMAEFKASLSPDDTLVLADSDEFHDMPDDYRDMALDCDCIAGNLFDRWDDDLHDAGADTPLVAQYPHQGDIYEHIRKKYNLTAGNWQWKRQSTKMLSHKVKFTLELSGNHFLSPGGPKPEITMDGMRIWHYTWRSGIIKRIMSRSYNPEWWTFQLMTHFGIGGDSDDYRAAVKLHQERQAEKGLAPIYA